MKNLCLFLLLTVFAAPQQGHCRQPASDTFTNPLLSRGGDPWALFHDGKYYYMQTTGERLDLWVCEDITDLRNATRHTVWKPGADPMCSHHVWAPEIHRIDGKWYIYFTAADKDMDNHRMFVLENTHSDPLKGRFEMKPRIVTDPADNWAIDGSVFTHRDTLYMVWSGWQIKRTKVETQCIYIARMENPWTLASERILISKPELEWERRYINVDGTRLGHIVYVNEGPQPLKSPEGRYIHIAYSASGVWTSSYCLGLLTAPSDANLLDPASWRKSTEPILQQSPENGVFCTGHNCFFPSPDGKEDYILYHARSIPATKGPGSERSPRAQKITWKDDYPFIGKPLPLSVALPKPSGTR